MSNQLIGPRYMRYQRLAEVMYLTLGEILENDVLTGASLQKGYRKGLRRFLDQSLEGDTRSVAFGALERFTEGNSALARSYLLVFAQFAREFDQPRKLTASDINTARLMRRFFIELYHLGEMQAIRYRQENEDDDE